MIPRRAIDAWRKKVPWNLSGQIEQDLLLSKAIVDLYEDPFIQEHLAFRGGTALQKLYFELPYRYSEDLDFVQLKPGPIGLILDKIKERLAWLGKPTWKIGEGRVTLYYKFSPTIDEGMNLKIKVEINTREHFQVLGISSKEFSVENNWFTGTATVTTYLLEELLATKLRALYQRKKGRDLFDLYLSIKQLNPDCDKIISAFKVYLGNAGLYVSRANFEENLFQKSTNSIFLNDIFVFVPTAYKEGYNALEAIKYLQKNVINLLPGEPWKAGSLELLLDELSAAELC